MTINKNLAIQKIEKEFEDLSNLILEQLQLLDELFNTEEKDRRDKISERLEKNERKIDKFEVLLEENIIRAIVLFSPMAKDLRRLFAIYHMTINLERVGDLVLKINITYLDIKDEGLQAESTSRLQSMLKITSRMVNKALLSFLNKDMEFASWTINKDMEFDDLNKKLLKKSIKSAGLPKDTQRVLNGLLDVRSIISSLERIGDHATNIAESSIYAISGSNIRHQNLDMEN